MQLIAIIIVPLIVGIVIGWLKYSRSGSVAGSATSTHQLLSRTDAEKLVDELVALGYYQYADAAEVNKLRDDLTDSLCTHGTISTIYDENDEFPLDYRYYSFDGESLFEGEGFSDMIRTMQGTFERMGVKMELAWQKESTEPESGGYNSEVMLNGKHYLIFKDFRGYGWGEAAQRFALMVNDQLTLQGKDEQLYLISGGNDGDAVFLSQAQFRLLDDIRGDKRW